MRWAVVSDVHGNLAALEAVLDAAQRAGVDGILSAGDVVGFGPDPNGCVRRMVQAGARCVAGNHELVVLERMGDHACGPRARHSQRWTRDVLDDDVREHIAGWPTRLDLGPVVVVHGSLDDPAEYVRSTAAAVAQLEALAAQHPDARWLVHGHTHHARVVDPAGATRRTAGRSWEPRAHPVLLNPGSVGQSRQRETRPHARWAVLDLVAGTATLRAEAYDHRATRAALARVGLPPDNVHLRPHPVRGAVRRVQRAFRPSTTSEVRP